MVDRFKPGDRLHAQYADGQFYAAEVIAVSSTKRKAKTPVKVHYLGYPAEDDAWLPLDWLHSKALAPELFCSALEPGMKLQVESDGVYYAAEVLSVSPTKRRKAPVKVRYLGFTAASDEWVGVERLRSKALGSTDKNGLRRLVPKIDENNGVLTVESVVEYVAKHCLERRGVPFKVGDQLTAKEIHGGNLNYAFAVMDDGKGSIFVKQAPGFIKVLGKEATLHRERMQLEVQWYKECGRALGNAAKKFLPKIHAFDRVNMVLVMDYLGDYELLQSTLFAGVAHEAVAGGLGHCMALAHAKTHCTSIDPKAVKVLTNRYKNSTLRGIQLEYVFSKCYREDDRAAHLREDAAFMAEVEKLKSLYRGENQDNLALCHGDLHAGSVMVNAAAGEVKIIDPEFAVYGPPGLDVGSLISTYVLAYCFHSAVKQSRHTGLLEDIKRIWSSYSDTMAKGGISGSAIESICCEAIGFAGCEVARTALGLAYERSLKIDDATAKDNAERHALAVGAACIINRQKGMTALTDALAKFDELQ